MALCYDDCICDIPAAGSAAVAAGFPCAGILVPAGTAVPYWGTAVCRDRTDDCTVPQSADAV